MLHAKVFKTKGEDNIFPILQMLSGLYSEGNINYDGISLQSFMIMTTQITKE